MKTCCLLWYLLFWMPMFSPSLPRRSLQPIFSNAASVSFWTFWRKDVLKTTEYPCTEVLFSKITNWPSSFAMTAFFCGYFPGTYSDFYNICMNYSEAALLRCSKGKVFRKYAANLRENTHAEVWVFFCKFAAYFQINFS